MSKFVVVLVAIALCCCEVRAGLKPGDCEGQLETLSAQDPFNIFPIFSVYQLFVEIFKVLIRE